LSSKKIAPKIHTKRFILHVVKTEDKILVAPDGAKAYMHFKRWAYQNLASKVMYWDDTAKLYAIDLEKAERTLGGSDILDDLSSKFDIRQYLPFED